MGKTVITFSDPRAKIPRFAVSIRCVFKPTQILQDLRFHSKPIVKLILFRITVDHLKQTLWSLNQVPIQVLTALKDPPPTTQNQVQALKSPEITEKKKMSTSSCKRRRGLRGLSTLPCWAQTLLN